MMNWYALYTASRAEKQVEKRLILSGIKTFLPLHLAPRRWSDRIKLVEVPLYSSYIFVYANDQKVRECLGVQGVARVVFYNGSPAVIAEREIVAIQMFLEQARAKELSYSIDEEVQIACGSLKNISGKIKRIGKKYLLLHLEQIGLTVSVAIDQVKKK
ncbi:MAG: UpxY family transcription antiterminator [Candidatus Azobacteroides sp.]|nr:UpxY family transcription antiterminator [Candidatus Azobacteroides sp.]